MSFLLWLKREWQLMWAEDFAPELHPVFSVENPKVAAMVARQRAYGKRLRREGRSLLGKDAKGYIPELTAPVKGAPAGRVTPRLRRVK